jgi:putative hemin transport protein
MSDTTQTPPARPVPITPDLAQRIRDEVRRSPGQMTLQLARRLGVPEVEVIRALPDGRVVELDAARWEELLRALEGLGRVHVIVSNAAVTCEVVGEFGGFSTAGEFFNVQSKSLDLHIRRGEPAAAFAVLKPSHMEGDAPAEEGPTPAGTLAGRRTTLSFQLFDRAGNSALKVFLNFGGVVTAERAAQFESLRDRFRNRET